MTFLCPLYREYLTHNPEKAFVQVKKYQDLSDEHQHNGCYNEAFYYAGKALEASELVLFHQPGWSVPALIQYTSNALHFCRLLHLFGNNSALVTNQYCIAQIKRIMTKYDLHRLSWAQECVAALTLQQDQIIAEPKDVSPNQNTKGEYHYECQSWPVAHSFTQRMH